MTTNKDAEVTNSDTAKAWERFAFSDVAMEFLDSGGLKRAISLALERGAKTIALVAKKRYLDELATIAEEVATCLATPDEVHFVTFSEIVQHVPAEVAKSAQSFAKENAIEAIVVVGGGSAIGTAKVMALALSQKRAFIAVPTTFSGSEMTPIYGITTEGRKVTTRDEAVRPTAVIYDISLFETLPPSIALPSIANAYAHAAEAFWGPNPSRTATHFAASAIEALSTGLKLIQDNSQLEIELALTTDSLRELTYGAALAAVAFGSTGSGLHHKLCHLIGGAFNLDHAKTHMIVGLEVLPKMALLHEPNRYHEVTVGIEAISGLIDRFQLPNSLASIGFELGKTDLLLIEAKELAKQVQPSLDQDQVQLVIEKIVGA
ncbi:MAG: iron-containing alcohol dehydrogenase [Actinomycetota bacterium]|nr:iron-containing alcohol dehydrogenase [Actinomycetota bacterium]